MTNISKKLMLCNSSYGYGQRSFPYVLLKGLWFGECGFAPGDQVIVTNPEPHTLVMKVHKTAVEMDEERRNRNPRASVRRKF